MKNYISILAIVIVDQVVKFMIRAQFQLGESVPVVKDLFYLTYVQNRGAAWSLFSGNKFMLIFIPITLIAVAVFFMEKNKEKISPFLGLAISFIIAGGIANQIDRIFWGYVTDMFDFRIWPVFNIADISVCVGAGMVFIYILFLEKKR